jgi:hypothetical protein
MWRCTTRSRDGGGLHAARAFWEAFAEMVRKGGKRYLSPVAAGEEQRRTSRSYCGFGNHGDALPTTFEPGASAAPLFQRSTSGFKILVGVGFRLHRGLRHPQRGLVCLSCRAEPPYPSRIDTDAGAHCPSRRHISYNGSLHDESPDSAPLSLHSWGTSYGALEAASES